MVLQENNVAISNSNVVPAEGIISKIHNMLWLKHRTIPDRSVKKEEEMSSKQGWSEKSSKKRNRRKPKLVDADSQKHTKDYLAMGGIVTTIQNAWTNDKDGAKMLFPNAEASVNTAALEENEEEFRIAIEESRRMFEAGCHIEETPTMYEQVEEVAQRSDEEDGYWNGNDVRKNLPKPDILENTKISDTNNNNNNNENPFGRKSDDRPAGRCIKARKSSPVNENVKNFVAAIEKSEKEGLLVLSEKPEFVKFDKFGRINGQNERHLFMGRGGRKKEREYLEQQQRQNQQQPKQNQPQPKQQNLEQPKQQNQQKPMQQNQQQPKQQIQEQSKQQNQQQPKQQNQEQQIQQNQQNQQQTKQQNQQQPTKHQQFTHCNVEKASLSNTTNQTKIPETPYSAGRPYYPDKFHFSKEHSKYPYERSQRPIENQRSPTSIKNDEKSLIPEKCSYSNEIPKHLQRTNSVKTESREISKISQNSVKMESREISKISQAPNVVKMKSKEIPKFLQRPDTVKGESREISKIPQSSNNSNFQSKTRYSDVNVENTHPDVVTSVSSNNEKSFGTHDENIQIKAEKKEIHLSDFHSRHNLPINVKNDSSTSEINECSSNTSVNFTENNDYQIDDDFSNISGIPECSTSSFTAPPPGFQCPYNHYHNQPQNQQYFPTDDETIDRGTNSYVHSQQKTYASLLIHDPSLVRFLLQNSRIPAECFTQPNYTPMSDDNTRTFLTTNDVTFPVERDINLSYDSRAEMMDDKYMELMKNRRVTNERGYENDSSNYYDNNESVDGENLAINRLGYLEKVTDSSGKIIETIYQELPRDNLKNFQGTLNLQPLMSLNLNEGYNYENLVVPETPRLQRFNQQFSTTTNFRPPPSYNSSQTSYNQSSQQQQQNYHNQGYYEFTSNSQYPKVETTTRRSVDSFDIGNNAINDVKQENQQTSRYSMLGRYENTEKFQNNTKQSRIPQQFYQGPGRGRGKSQKK